MTAKTDISKAASEAAGSFELAKRSDGESVVILRRDVADWVADLVRNAHGDMLPDDWRYQTIRAACEFLVEDDEASDFADAMVDAYTNDRIAWLGSHASRVGYCDEGQEELGYDSRPDVLELIAFGQFMEAREIFDLVLEELRKHAEDA